MASASFISNDPEEGEIVDDDYEDISDNSISISFCSGKSVTPNTHLPAVYLSSESDMPLNSYHRHSPVRKKKSYKKHKRRYHKTSSSSGNSDIDEYWQLDKNLQNQLKAAVRVDTEGCHKNNSLRTRLRGMTHLDNPIDKQVQSSPANQNDLDELDSELITLRMEALRTAILNKFKCRKRKNNDQVNDVLSDSSRKTDTPEFHRNVDVIPEDNLESKRPCLIEHIEDNTNEEKDASIPEEDEDVLRALLLASVTKKITKKTNSKTDDSTSMKHKDKELLVLDTQKPTEKVTDTSVLFQLPKIQPLIINLNADSDSEDDNSKTHVKNTDQLKTNNIVNTQIESTVKRFLKEQRAKVEAQKAITPETKSTSKLEKSAVKLLPKEKQIEYRKLLQKLKNAEKYKVKKPSHVTKTNSVKFQKNIPVGNRVLVNKQTDATTTQQGIDIKDHLKLLHKTLKQMQIVNNGKLQIQKKYVGLTATIKKINEISTERKSHEEDIKRLLDELTGTKRKLLKAHTNFVHHVKELVIQKEKIDLKTKKLADSLITSTPIKQNLSESFNTNAKIKTVENHGNQDKENIGENVVDKEVKTNFTQIEQINKNEKESGSSLTVGKCENGDEVNDKPNEETNNCFPKYVSPLDNVNSKVHIDDPFSIMCPYDINGSCCDPECIYKHYCK